MIEQIEIRNYRALDHLVVRDLARINVVAGRNNSGKTSLLEAVFLLACAPNPNVALNPNVVRTGEATSPSNPHAIRETLWKPMYSQLDTGRSILVEASGRHKPITLVVRLESADSTNVALTYASSSDARVLTERMVFRYCDADTVTESSCRLMPTQLELTHEALAPLFPTSIVLPRNGNVQEDAMRLGELRKQKRGDLVLKALQTVEPRLRSIEENSSGGLSMIWGDVGLDELVPLPVMGEGMSRLARLVLGIADSANGVLLVDEIETGFHHSVLPDMWRAIDAASEQFGTQVLATTHSFECLQAADGVLGPDFAVHRLETDDTGNKCVTYARDVIAAAIRHDLEVR